METKITNRIKEIAEKHCEDYPNISDIEPWEQLYAIDSSLEGETRANNDLHRIIKELSNKYNIPYEEVLEIDIKINREIRP